ncbi:hypothetical protein BCR32DRAFT_292017 [Anaeromyces robustus]|uniref:Trichohyalin-plectin-homology domain-containing protein n=1 Tax=Anaeromyces robustus TaxID=1754192 RepID=A0A1Y1XCJ5_9FUNG|nr:hypothetical protein BCR32DRAFT_292017 [Anaeromyces robustus]|eukprot:ORX83442.1 hypothetical protein BCR32DRAFT_292017 [Anaeromyces robustus]
MNKEYNYIPYNAKLNNEEIKALFSKNSDIKNGYNVININEYNNILKSFDLKNEREQYLVKKAQEREKLRKKGMRLTERIKDKSKGHRSAHQRMKEKEILKEKEKQKIDDEWKKIMDKEKEEEQNKIREKIFNARSDVIKFNKKIQESNMYYERKLQIEFNKKRKELIDKMNKEIEQKQLKKQYNDYLLEKFKQQKRKLEAIETEKQIKEQILKNKERRKQNKKEEDESILNSRGLVFDPERSKEEEKKGLEMLYADINKQIQLKNKLKFKKLEEEKKLEMDIIEYNNNKSIIQEKIDNVKKDEINKRIEGAKLAGRNIKSKREEIINEFFEIRSNKEPLFNDESDIKIKKEYMKHYLDNTKFQLKQIEEAKQLREKEKKEIRKFYYDKGVKAYNELKEEEKKQKEKEKTVNLEQLRINKELVEDKKRRMLERINDPYIKSLEEKKKKEDEEFNNYVLNCIGELKAKGRDTRNMYSSLIGYENKDIKKDINMLPDTFRRLGINGIHNADENLLNHLKNTNG